MNLRTKTIILGIVIVLAVVALFSWRSACTSADRARKEASIASATGEQLDKVAAETPVIRQEQVEKQREVDTIAGADQRLPDGFGADLERVRKRPAEPRNP